jgi:hypothetical protein
MVAERRELGEERCRGSGGLSREQSWDWRDPHGTSTVGTLSFMYRNGEGGQS